MKYKILFAFLFGFSCAHVQAQEPTATNETAVVMFHGKELFEVSKISSVSASVRAETLLRRFKRQAKSPLTSTEKFTIHQDDHLMVSVLMSGSEILCAVWEIDAEYYGIPREQLAEQWLNKLKEVIEQYRRDYTVDSILKDSAFAVLATLGFLILWFLVRKLCKKEVALIDSKFAGQKMFKFLDGDSIVTINGSVVKSIRMVVMLCIFIFYLNLVLSFFPWTFNLSAQLFHLISTPVINFGHAFVEHLPNLFALLVIGFIVHLILRGLQNIFSQVGEGKVRIKGFYQDWADPTFRLIRIVIIVFAMVIAFPYIPGSSSPAFKGISIFMGVLFSLGSTSAIGNIVAGLVLTYMRPFVTSDFVEISGMRGIVMSRGTFSTLLKTPTNEIISIPNASVSTNHIINFSRMAAKGGVNMGATVTIGYDVPWRTVHELLIAAATGVPDVLETPEPKVLQLGLDDFYVQYKLIVTTKHPERRVTIRSALHQNIQDQFTQAKIEILSPHYRANRSGEETTIPSLGETEV